MVQWPRLLRRGWSCERHREVRHQKELQCYTDLVPTTKQRITITATGELERILDAQARLHPDLSPSALVAMLIERATLPVAKRSGEKRSCEGLPDRRPTPPAI